VPASTLCHKEHALSVLLVLFVLLAAVAASFVLVLLAVPRRRALVALDEAAFPSLARLRRSAVVSRRLAFVAGIAVIVPLGSSGELGRGLMLVPAAFASVLIIGVLAGDAFARNDARTPGAAGLEVRRVRDFLPRRLALMTSLTAVALTVFLAWATAIASPDDLGRAGRSLAFRCVQDCTAGSVGPWPGSFYSVPMSASLLVVALLGGLTLLTAVRRPRDGSDPDIVGVDDVVRRRCVESVVASMGLAVSGSLAGVGLLAGGQLASLGVSHGPIALQLAGWVTLAVGSASVFLAVWCVVILLLPGAGARVGQHLLPVGGSVGAAETANRQSDPGGQGHHR
jgi:hypothetical protein